MRLFTSRSILLNIVIVLPILLFFVLILQSKEKVNVHLEREAKVSTPDLNIRLYLNECEESRCDIIWRRDELLEADAVIFNNFDLAGFRRSEVIALNKARARRQIFVYFNMEAPRQGREKIRYVTQEELGKKKFAVMMTSHCRTKSKRLKLIEELMKSIPISVYGKCGNLKCGTRTLISSVSGQDPSKGECTELIKTFAFYLAFENTLCTEYATEKFYRTLEIGVVPITYGGSNYSTLAPPNSYIDLKEFESPAQLADFMITVAKNATLYNSYLRWKEDYEVEVGSPYKPFVCDLCKRLHQRKPDE